MGQNRGEKKKTVVATIVRVAATAARAAVARLLHVQLLPRLFSSDLHGSVIRIQEPCCRAQRSEAATVTISSRTPSQLPEKTSKQTLTPQLPQASSKTFAPLNLQSFMCGVSSPQSKVHREPRRTQRIPYSSPQS
jgi:hypothetical protein